jgi:hypothetical protein
LALGPSCMSSTPQLKRERSPRARIPPDSRKSERRFKGMICDDISEFESDMPSHAVRSHQPIRERCAVPARRSDRRVGALRIIPVSAIRCGSLPLRLALEDAIDVPSRAPDNIDTVRSSFDDLRSPNRIGPVCCLLFSLNRSQVCAMPIRVAGSMSRFFQAVRAQPLSTIAHGFGTASRDVLCLVRTAGEHHQFTAAIRLTSS